MIPAELISWAQRHGVSGDALGDLVRMLLPSDLDVAAPPAKRADEAAVQGGVRYDAARAGWRLYRNNVGALLDTRGVPVRYGLANDTPAVNKKLKSGDLIGWRPVLITPAHVGAVIAQFASLECKAPGWTYRGTEREEAQSRWATLVVAAGGYAKFTTGDL